MKLLEGFNLAKIGAMVTALMFWGGSLKLCRKHGICMNSKYKRHGSWHESMSTISLLIEYWEMVTISFVFVIWYAGMERSALSNQEVVAGKPLAEFLRHEILEPLQLTETFFQVPLHRQDDLAALYKREPWHGSSSLSGINMIDVLRFLCFFGYSLRFDRRLSN